jgi:hypothetical protein
MIIYILHFAHHNHYHSHRGIEHGNDWIKQRFYWPYMVRDMKKFVLTCHLCQLAKDGKRSKFGLLEHVPLPEIREQVQCDYAGPFWNLFYTLCLLCPASHWIMLLGLFGCGARETFEAIINNWVPILGWFKSIHSDLGSAFVSRMIKRISKAFGIKNIYASAGDHRGIGKIERRIRVLKDSLQKWNLESNKLLTDDKNDVIKRCEMLEIALGFIMFGMNQDYCKFSQTSANELMFGEQLREIPYIAFALGKLKDINKDNKLKKNEVELVEQLQNNLKVIRSIFKKDHEKYLYVMKRDYDIGKKNIKFKKNEEVMYYCGSRKQKSYKLLNKWSGPWKVVEHTSPSMIKLYNPKDGIYKKVKVDFIKRYIKREFESIKSYEDKIRNNEINDEATQEDYDKLELLFINLSTNNEISQDLLSNN